MTKKHIPYFRFYPSDFMGGVRGLSAQEIGVYTMLLCRMYEESGPIEYHILRLATYCGMREKTFQKVAEKLVALGKIDLEDGRIFNDRARQEISDRSDDLKNAITAGKASAKKRQEKQRQTATTVQRPFNHTDTDTDTDTKERDTNVSLALSAPEHASPAAEAVTIYNEAAEIAGWPKVQKMTPARSKALNARLRECGGIDGWRLAMDKGKQSDFLCGRTDRQWSGCGFDWMTKQANFAKLMEGNYDNRGSEFSRNSSAHATAREIAYAAAARRTPSENSF